MPETASSPTSEKSGWYSYSIVRVVPRVERGEFLNAGVILFARTLGFLKARIELDEERLSLLWPAHDLPRLKRHLATFQAIADGDPAGGPVAVMDASARFHWLTAPRSTTIQTSPVHIGYCDDPESLIEDLMRRLVRRETTPDA